ncbi:MAG: hypothetical protein OHK0013_05650 [Sandaracinaceae bacterium]
MTRLRLDRRRFLLGLGGVAVALPFLESIHAPRARAGEDRFRFAFFVRSGNGVAQRQRGWRDGMEVEIEPEQFWPRTVGPIDARILGTDNADRATSELAPFASRIALVRGLNRPFSTPSCGHSDSIVQLLTAAQIQSGSSNDAAALDRSIDWRITSQLGGRDPMTLMAGPTSAYIRENLSWSAARVRTPAQRRPLDQYMEMMGITSAPPEIQARIVERQNSVNDLVRDELQALLSRRDLGMLDRQRLQQHFEAIRDTEVSLLSCTADDPAFMSGLVIDNPEGNDVRVEVVRQHMNVMALAAACNYTRAATLQVGEGNDQTQYRLADGTVLPRFHWISHRIYSDGAEGETIPNAVDLHHQVDRIQLRLFRHLLERLDMYTSPYGGSLLDDGVCVWVNDLANGPPHGGTNVPWILAGSAGDRLRTGVYVDAGGVTYNKILNTIGAAVGCTESDGSPLEHFGDASLAPGRVDELVLGES